MIDIESLWDELSSVSKTQICLTDRYRVRLLEEIHQSALISEICPTTNSESILIDLYPIGLNDSSSSDDVTVRLSETVISLANDTTIGAKQEGSPLKVTFLNSTKMVVDSSNTDGTTRRSGSVTDSAGLDVRPIPAPEARRLLSACNVSWKPENSKNYSVIVACDATDPLNILFLSSCRLKTQIRTVVVTAKGYGRVSDLTPLCDISRLLGPIKREQNTISSCIIMLPNVLPDQTVVKEDIQNANVIVNAVWKTNHSEEMLTPPPADSRVTVTVSPGWQDSRSPVYKKSMELLCLNELASGLQSGKILWSGSGTVSFQNEEISVVSAVQNMVEATKSAMFMSDQKNTHSSFANYQNERTDLDFTESLWKILLHCNSNKQLIESFQVVFSALATGDFKPLIHRTNRTSLAKFVRDAYQQQLMVPRLEGLYPLQLLVELGVEKLRRDYMDAFCTAGSELVTSSELTECFDFKKSIENQVTQLRIPHCTLEIVSLCSNHLRLPNERLTYVARDCLAKARSCTDLGNFVFSFEVRPNHIPDIIANWRSEWWKMVSDYSLIGDSSARTIIHFGLKPLFPFGYYTDKTGGQTVDCDLFYCTHSLQNIVDL